MSHATRAINVMIWVSADWWPNMQITNAIKETIGLMKKVKCPHTKRRVDRSSITWRLNSEDRTISVNASKPPS